MIPTTTAVPRSEPLAKGLDIEQIYQRYIAAWRARDVDAILGLHAEETQYRYRAGQSPAVGPDAVRSAFASIFRRWPGYDFEEYRVLFGRDHWVLDWALIVTERGWASRPVEFRVDCVDIVTVDGEGLVTRKDTFVDMSHVRTAVRRAIGTKLLNAVTFWWPR